MILEIDGRQIKEEADFHRILAKELDLGPYYGRNLDALWDRLSTDVERPVTLIWHHSAESKANLGDVFDKIVRVLARTQQQDESFGWDDRFRFELR